MNLSAYKLQLPSKYRKRAEWIKEAMERSPFAKACLLCVVLLGTCMVIGDGILTPCISDVVVMISVAILVILFSIQKLGTDKVGYTFAPAILTWYLSTGIIGTYNIVHHDSSVLKAFNPIYIVRYFNSSPKEAWISLGGVVLCVTVTEAMFADLGHFSVKSIQIAFTGLVYPCLIFVYVGQAAYLSNFPANVGDAFYKSTPDFVYWPMFAIAVMASIIASQAMISATFAIIKQSMALGCFPRVQVIHTSHKHEVLYKFTKGRYLPLTFAAVLFFVIYVWYYVQTKRYAFEVEQKVSTNQLNSISSNPGITRVPGVGLLYTELMTSQSSSPTFLTNLPAIHSILVFVSVKYVPVNKVPAEERFLHRRVG